MVTVVSDRVIVELEAKIDRYNQNVQKAERQFQRSIDSMNRQAGSLTKTMGGIGSSFNALIGAAVASVGLSKLGELIDTSKKIEAQLKLATKETGSFAKAQEDVRRISAATRTELDATAGLYANFLRNARELNATQAQSARATETVAKAFKISGADAGTTAAGVKQLTQALQSGTLRGDEFNSMMEGAPRLSKLLADSLGVVPGQLRKMAEAGELTSEKLFRALTDKKFTAALDEEFKTMPVTFGEAMTSIENAAIVVFGAFDKGGQFSTAINSFVLDGTDGFMSLERAAENFGRTVAGEFAGIIAFGQNVIGTLQAIDAALGGLPSKMASFAANNAMYLNPAMLAINGLRQSPTYQQAKNQREGDLALKAIMSKNSLRDILPPEYQAKPKPFIRPASGKKGGGGKGRKGASGPSAEQIAERYDNQMARLMSDELRSQMDITTDAAARADLEKQMLELQRAERLEQINNEKGFTAAQKAALTELVNRVYGQPGQVDPVTGEIVTQAKPGLMQQGINRDLERRLERMKQEELEGEARALEAQAGIELSLDKRREIEARILAIQQEVERRRLEEAIAAGEVADATKARADLAKQQAAEGVAQNRANASPGQKYLIGLQEEAANLGNAYEQVAVDGMEKLSDSVTNATKDLLGLHGVLGDIIGDIIEIGIRQAIIGPIASALFGGGAGGGGGLLGSVIGGLFGGGRASGGHVQAGRAYEVGERGRELFMPGQSGKVIPTGQIRTASMGVQTGRAPVFVDARGAVMNDKFADMILMQANRYSNEAAGEAYGRAVKAAPDAVEKRKRYGT